jgi:class 3 adenylate cyclase
MEPVDVAAWLQDLGLARYQEAFARNAVDAEVLLELTAEDLKDLGVEAVGRRRKLLAAIAAMRRDKIPAEEAATTDAERRQLTVLFCDLVGSTALSARLDPEDGPTRFRGCAIAAGRTHARLKAETA